jgi:hypothetical protein
MNKIFTGIIATLSFITLFSNTALALSDETIVDITASPMLTSTVQEAFSDLTTDHPNYTAITSLKNSGIIQGYDDGTFRPENHINRVEALKLAFEVGGLTVKQGVAPAEFLDTEDAVWYTSYLNMAVYMEIVQGYPDGTFKPEQNVNLVEFLKMVLLAQNADLTNTELSQIPYADVMPGQWYTKYVNFAKIHNLIDPDTENKIKPGEDITRAQAAEIIYRYKNIDWTKTATIAASEAINDADFALYVNNVYKFAVKYPKIWFYAGGASETAGVVREYLFGPDDLAINPAKVKLELLPLSTEVVNNTVYDGVQILKTADTEKIYLTRKIEGDRVYRISGADTELNRMLYMIKSVTNQIDGLESYNPAEPAATTETTTETTTTEGQADTSDPNAI